MVGEGAMGQFTKICGAMLRSLDSVLRSQGSHGRVKQGKDLGFTQISLKGVNKGI